jgi:hypothetical protein
VNSSILAALIAGILSLFGLHQPIAYRAPAVSPSAIVAAAAASITPNAGSGTDPQSAPTPFTNAPDTSASSPNYVTQGALTAQLSALEKTIVSELQSLASALTSVAAQNQNGNVPASSTIQQQLAALQHEISQTNQIDNLSNVTITSPSFSGLTASDILALDYLSLSGGTLAGDLLINGNATTSNFFASNASATNISAQTFTANGTSTLANIILSSLNCSTYGNGGKLTTDSFGNVVCAADQSGGAGSTVAGSDTEIQFNSGGSFAASAAFTFSSTRRDSPSPTPQQLTSRRTPQQPTV